MSIETMKQWLEALTYAYHEDEAHPNSKNIIASLSQAIAEAEKKAHEFPKRFNTHPQPKREPLTDEQIEKMRHLIDWTAHWSYGKFARAIEAKLKEKNT